MEKKKFGFGIVGTGMIAETHAMAIAGIGHANLIGAYSISKDKRDRFARKHNCRAFETLEEMAKDPAIDIVCICTPSGIHLEPALTCIAGGKHCLVEKPLEVNLERCDLIIEAARKAGVKLGVIFPSRFQETNRRLKMALEKTRFGNLVLGDAYVKWSRSKAYYDSAAWRGTWQLDGGGALMNQGIHSVDLLQWFMGPVQSVQALTANIRHKEIEVEDTVVAMVKFVNGALGTIECSTAVFPGSYKRIEIMGTTGTVVIEENSLVKWQFEQETPEDDFTRKTFSVGNSTGGGASDPAAIGYAGHQHQIEDMILAIETGSSPLIDGREGRKSVEIVRAIYDSARTGEAVRLGS
ncbi:Gfo/Idh/MocA family protein [Flavitalea flava]